MNNVSKKKIAAGYVVLLAVLLYSLFFVHREMENLMSSDNSDILRTDSLIGLLREKDANTVRLLRTLSEANDSIIKCIPACHTFYMSYDKHINSVCNVVLLPVVIPL